MANLATERLILDRVTAAVERETGLTARVLRWEPKLREPDRRPDALIEIAGPQGMQQFVVEIKNTVDRLEILNHARAFWPRHNKPPLLIAAPYVTQQMAERCRELQIYFADVAGNTYLEAPGLHIYVIGKRKALETRITEEGRTNNPAGMRVVFALLGQPILLNATYRDIAAAARVALGTVGGVIKDLETRKHITNIMKNGRTPKRGFIDPRRLVQEWATLYPTVLRPKLNLRRLRAPLPNWTRGVDLKILNAFWGGEVAANRLVHYLEPQAVTIYARETPTQLIVDQRMRADINGNVEILDVFWNARKVPGVDDVVPPLLAYADLMTTTDGRDQEAATMIYDEFIGPALSNYA